MHDLRENSFKPTKQFASARVRQPHPHDRGSFGRQNPALGKIIVFRHDDSAGGERIILDFLVRRAGKPDVGDMLGFLPLAREPARKRGRQLCVDEETHQATRNTG